ncbi:MAG: hypothetical protein EXX96DRAFT_576956 [Benjaminiella poitrasii]|nr:MAG: hypothetical protein EXX96DRAFT_576956 [Benjaminiella poitrasii]
MHRFIRTWTLRIHCDLHVREVLLRTQSKRVLPQLSAYYYSSAAITTSKPASSTTSFTIHPLVANYQDQLQQNGPKLWQSYEALKTDSYSHLQDLKREDFSKLRSDLWKRKSWGTEDRILEVLNDMKQTGLTWTTHEYTEYFMAKLFKAEYHDVLQTYRGEFQQSALKLSVGSFNVILATYLALNMEKDAIQLIQNAHQQHDVIPDIRDFIRTMNRCMPKNTPIIQLAKNLVIKHAFDNDTNALNTNILHLFREKMIDDVNLLYKQCHSGKRNKLELSTYNAFIKGYMDARLIRDAIKTYKDMQEDGIKPNIYICSSMLSIYAHNRDVASAENIVRETILSGHKPDENLYNQLIKVYFKARQTQKAVRVFEEIRKNPQMQINDIILNTMIDGLVINKELKIASLLYRQMTDSHYKPDLITLNTMLKGYTRAGDISSAIGIISDMFKLGMEPDIVTFTTLVGSVFRTKAPKTAEEMINIITDQLHMTPNIYTFNAVIDSWIQSQNIEQAEKTLKLMQSPKYKQIKPTIHTYTNLIQGYINQMNLNKAMTTFQSMLRNGIRPDRATFNFMIVGFLNHNRTVDAYTCLEHMISMKLNPTKDTWKLLLDDCCQKKNWVIGRKVVEMLDQTGFVITSDSLRRSYTTVKKHCT